MLRVGTVPYLVGRPLDLGLEDEPGVALVRAVPAKLVEGLRQGSLDVALVSSIELFRRPGYGYLDGPTVAGRGPVASVQVFLRRPLEAVRSVVLDPSSRTAQALTRVVLPPRLAQPPGFVELAPGEDPRAAAEGRDADAWLAIGDPALRTALAADAPPAFDPTQAWLADTGLPFVFAAWVVRPGARVEPRLRAAFAAARTRGTARIADLAGRAAREWRLPREACLRYLAEQCHFDVGAELRPALLAFRDAAARLGLCAPDLEPRALALPAAPCPG